MAECIATNPDCPLGLRAPIRAVCLDWGDTLMADDGPPGVPMCQWPRVTAIPGARECLAALHGRVPLYVATNAGDSDQASIQRALGRVELASFFTHVFCLVEIGVAKSEPEYWQVVQTRLGLPASAIAMIGDDVETDVLRPREAGIQTVWFNQGGCHPDPSDPVATVTGLVVFAQAVLRVLDGHPNAHGRTF